MPQEHDDTAAPPGPVVQDAAAAIDAASAGLDEPHAEPAGDVVPRAELEKVIGERQAAKQRARKAEQQLAAMQTPDADGEAPDGEPLAGDVKPVAGEDADALRQKLLARESQLAAVLRDQQIRRAAAGAGALNPDQVVGILRSRVVMTEQADGALAATFLDEQGRVLLADDGAPVDAEAFVERFLADAANANLLSPSSSPGSGARPMGGVVESVGAPSTLAEFHSLPPDQRRAAAMRMSRRQREAMMGVVRPGSDGYL